MVAAHGARACACVPCARAARPFPVDPAAESVLTGLFNDTLRMLSRRRHKQSCTARTYSAVVCCFLSRACSRGSLGRLHSVACGVRSVHTPTRGDGKEGPRGWAGRSTGARRSGPSRSVGRSSPRLVDERSSRMASHPSRSSCAFAGFAARRTLLATAANVKTWWKWRRVHGEGGSLLGRLGALEESARHTPSISLLNAAGRSCLCADARALKRPPCNTERTSAKVWFSHLRAWARPTGATLEHGKLPKRQARHKCRAVASPTNEPSKVWSTVRGRCNQRRHCPGSGGSCKSCPLILVRPDDCASADDTHTHNTTEEARARVQMQEMAASCGARPEQLDMRRLPDLGGGASPVLNPSSIDHLSSGCRGHSRSQIPEQLDK